LPQDWFVQRVWSPWGKHDIVCLIEVKTKKGVEYFSAGYSENGLLGQGENKKGGKIKKSREFALLSMPSKDTTFKQISVGKNFALAVDQNDGLWAWGNNATF
jgi:hypothetical protein